MLDVAQVRLVQDSFVHCVPIPDEVAATFYARLFAIAPSTRPLFKSDMVSQGRKLVMTLAAVVDGLERLDEIVPIARELAIRHESYGVREVHYAAVGTALLGTLNELLGPMFDAKTKAAWEATYALVAETMIGATRPAA